MSSASVRVRLVRAVVLVGILGVLAAACSDSQPGANGDDPGLVHVHGLGVDPADDELYVATHFGMFRVRDGEAERMGTHMQDLMGFTIAGPDRFLASGHPDPHDDPILADDVPPLLGLVESDDRGETWQALSLQGEADFHALDVAHGEIYAFDATGGQFMVSPDGETWEHRSDATLLSFAVSPDDPGLVIATTFDGEVVTSDDGGRTWTSVPGAPTLTFLSWDGDAGLWGLGPDGSAHVGTGEGRGWQSRGTVDGRPAALLAHPDALYAATADAILTSTDGGAAWTVLYEID